MNGNFTEELNTEVLKDCTFNKQAQEENLNCQHPYVKQLIEESHIELKSLFHLMTVTHLAYRNSASYLLGKVAYEILRYNFIENGNLTEEELKFMVLKHMGLIKQMENAEKKVDICLPYDKSNSMKRTLSIISDMNEYDFLQGENKDVFKYVTPDNMELLSSYNTCVSTAALYYKFKDTKIESFIEESVIPKIERKKSSDNSVWVK